jgi:hypothetical protein
MESTDSQFTRTFRDWIDHREDLFSLFIEQQGDSSES